MHVVGGQHEFPVHQLLDPRGLVSAVRVVVAPAKRLFQNHLGCKQLAQFQPQRGG